MDPLLLVTLSEERVTEVGLDPGTEVLLAKLTHQSAICAVKEERVQPPVSFANRGLAEHSV